MASTLRPIRLAFTLLLAAFLPSAHLSAQAPAPKGQAKPKAAPPVAVDHLGIKLIPQPGIEIAAADRAELEKGASALAGEIASLRQNLSGKPDQLALIPDIEIFHKAVDWALRYNEFFDPKQVDVALKLLTLGTQRATELKAGRPGWLDDTGLVVRGYLSKVDGSVQPYGMVIPEDWKPGETKARRLDFTSRFGFAPDMAEGSERVFIVYDPVQQVDAVHAALFRGSHVTKLRARNIGRDPQAELARIDALRPLIDAACQGTLTDRAFFRLWRARRDNVHYLGRLIGRIQSQNRPARLLRALRIANQRADHPQLKQALARAEAAAASAG